MSYTYLQEQGEESSAESYSDIPQFVLLRLSLTADESCSKDSETEFCQNSQSGTTSKPLTESLGAEKSTLYAEGSRAKTSAQQEEARELKASEAGFGERWRESLAKYDPNTHSWRTPQCSLFGGLDEFSETWPSWGIMLNGVCWGGHTLDYPASASESGFWPAPTCERWGSEGAQKQLLKKVQSGEITKETAERMMVRHFRKCVTEPSGQFPWRDGEVLNLDFYEHIMAWPHSWTDTAPLATDKFQQWLRLHGKR